MPVTSRPSPDQFVPMDQLVNMDAQERAHRPDGTIMSNHERQLIEENQELISDGLAGFQTVAEKMSHDAQLDEKNVHRALAMKVVNDAVASGDITEFSAGPDYIKATGLAHDDVLALGFNGFGDLRTAAEEYKADQQTKDAEILADNERSYDTAKRQEAADEHARQWRAETDAAKAAREAAELERREANIDAVIAHGEAVLARDSAEKAIEDRVSQLSYAEMLKRGGSIGQKRNPVQAAEVNKAALERAKAEGFDKDNLPDIPEPPVLQEAPAPEPFAVVTNKEAEARQAELARLLREHDTKILEAAVSPDTEVLEAAASPESEPVSEMNVADLLKVLGKSDFATLREAGQKASENDSPAVDRDPSLETSDGKRRFSKVFSRAGQKLVEMHFAAQQKINLYLRNGSEFNDIDPKRQRRAVLGAVLGAGAVYLGMKLGADIMSNGSVETVTPGGLRPSTEVDPTVIGGDNAGIKPGVTTEALPSNPDKVMQEVPIMQKLEAGGSVWSESVDYADKLGHSLDMNNPQDVQVADAIKDQVLRMNNITDPTHLPVGYELRMPHPAEIEEILKQYKK